MKPFAKKVLALVSAAAISLSAIPAVRSVDSEMIPAAQTPVTARARTISTARTADTRSYARIQNVGLELTSHSEAVEPASNVAQPAKYLVCSGAAVDPQSLQTVRQLSAEEAAVIMGRVVSLFSDWQKEPEEPKRDLGKEVSELALTKVGCRYVSGGHGPSKFDCSGLVYWVYKQFGYDLKPGARNQWSILGNSVKKADLQPGDLLFFSRNGKASGIFHVGIYIGDGKFVHAANSRKGVIVTGVNESWYARRYLGAKRAID